MTTKYTSVRWKATGSHLAWFVSTEPEVSGNEIVRVHQSESIAEVREKDSPEEMKAIALLIAAAPDLAEALKAALPILLEAEEQWSNGDDCYTSALHKARHALQKAGLVS